MTDDRWVYHLIGNPEALRSFKEFLRQKQRDIMGAVLQMEIAETDQELVATVRRARAIYEVCGSIENFVSNLEEEHKRGLVE